MGGCQWCAGFGHRHLGHAFHWHALPPSSCRCAIRPEAHAAVDSPWHRCIGRRADTSGKSQTTHSAIGAGRSDCWHRHCRHALQRHGRRAHAGSTQILAPVVCAFFADRGGAGHAGAVGALWHQPCGFKPGRAQKSIGSCDHGQCHCSHALCRHAGVASARKHRACDRYLTQQQLPPRLDHCFGDSGYWLADRADPWPDSLPHTLAKSRYERSTVAGLGRHGCRRHHLHQPSRCGDGLQPCGAGHFWLVSPGSPWPEHQDAHAIGAFQSP